MGARQERREETSRWVRQRHRQETSGPAGRPAPLCLLQLLGALSQQGWKVGTDQTPPSECSGRRWEPLLETLMVRDQGHQPAAAVHPHVIEDTAQSQAGQHQEPLSSL